MSEQHERIGSDILQRAAEHGKNGGAAHPDGGNLGVGGGFDGGIGCQGGFINELGRTSIDLGIGGEGIDPMKGIGGDINLFNIVEQNLALAILSKEGPIGTGITGHGNIELKGVTPAAQYNAPASFGAPILDKSGHSPGVG